MKLLLVMPNVIIYPVGVAYISSALKRAGHDVDCMVFSSDDALAKRVQRRGYDFVASGGLSCEYAKLNHILGIARQAGVKTIAGGGIVTSEPELMSQALQVDYGVIGEGEETIVELLACLEDGGKVSEVKGLCYRRGDDYTITGDRKQLEYLDALAWPDYEAFGFECRLDALKPNGQYNYDVFDYPREYALVGSRSCPFLCTFCYHPSGNKYRQRSVDSIMAELEERIPKYRINIVSIYDELFSHNRERLYEFCRRLKAFTDTLDWEVKWSCQLRVDGVDEELLGVMRDAGCFLVSYGFESYSPTVLKSMKKYIKPEQIHNAIHTTMNSRISIQANFIFGDVAETMDTATETLNFWKKHPEAGIQLVPILVCPDSQLYRHCLQTGIIKNRLHFIKHGIFKCYNLTGMSNRGFDRMRILLHLYGVRHSVYATPLEIGQDYVKVECPHCREVITYNNYRLTGKRFKQKMYCRVCRKRFHAVHLGYQRFVRQTWLVILKYKFDNIMGGTKARIIKKLKLYPIAWRLHQWHLRRVSADTSS